MESLGVRMSLSDQSVRSLQLGFGSCVPQEMVCCGYSIEEGTVVPAQYGDAGEVAEG